MFCFLYFLHDESLRATVSIQKCVKLYTDTGLPAPLAHFPNTVMDPANTSTSSSSSAQSAWPLLVFLRCPLGPFCDVGAPSSFLCKLPKLDS